MPKQVKTEAPKMKMPRKILRLGEWTINEINGLPEEERYRKLIEIDEQIPPDIRAHWRLTDVAEVLGIKYNTVNTYINLRRLVPDGRSGARGDKWFYPATILRYLLEQRERDRQREQARSESAE